MTRKRHQDPEPRHQDPEPRERILAALAVGLSIGCGIAAVAIAISIGLLKIISLILLVFFMAG